MKRTVAAWLACLVLASMTVLTLCACASGQSQTPVDDSPQLIDVKVVDKVRSNISGVSFDSYWVETSYEYDEDGKLTGMSQSSNYAQSNINKAKSIFEYDDAGRLVKVSRAFEQYQWNVGNAEMFTYNDQGLCTDYSYEIVSQGNGGIAFSYSYDDGRIASAVVANRVGQDTKTFDVSWSYLNDGRISKAVSGIGSEAGFGLVDELSDPDQGVYAYRNVYDGITTLKYNEDGSLASSSTRSKSSNEASQEVYEYKTITVDPSKYVPSIYSNPTGFDARWKPQVTLAEVPQSPSDQDS